MSVGQFYWLALIFISKPMPKQLKAFVKSIEEKEGILNVAVATDDSVDRDGERIDPKGWDFSNYERNPVLLFAHDYSQEPIGKVLEIRVEGSQVLFKPQFAVDISERAKRIFELYKKGYLNAFSVGFIPREWKEVAEDDGKMVLEFTKAELLEISAVPVPANPEAVVLARSKGLDIDANGDRLIKEELAPEGESEEARGEEESEEGTDNAGTDDRTGEEEKAIEEKVEKLTSVVESLQKSVAELQSGIDRISKVEQNAQDLAVKNAKKILQTIDKSVGKTLRDLKKNS